MGALLIAIWMLLILPVLIVGAGLGGSLALDRVFARANSSDDGEGSGEGSGEDAAEESEG
ncbi:MAG: hypothetical protein DCC49_07950 [Acidobacteria bacterium]|nr:MAG: hypothetical protein DCC49_07950 [Acidobacteriota bacterium]